MKNLKNEPNYAPSGGPRTRRGKEGSVRQEIHGCSGSDWLWSPLKGRGCWAVTHHFKVLGSALGALEVAGQQHFVDVVAGAIVKLPHVERPRLEVMEIRLDLQALQDALLHEVHVPDLVPA